MDLKLLIGSGDRIGRLVLPFLAVGVALNALAPSVFAVGGPPPALKALSALVLVPGVVGWLWSVALILAKVPRRQLITNGPFAVVRHPLYTSVALLVLPWVGFLLDSWLGVVLGLILYIGSRLYAPQEEKELARTFGAAWDEYSRSVMIPWLQSQLLLLGLPNMQMEPSRLKVSAMLLLQRAAHLRRSADEVS